MLLKNLAVAFAAAMMFASSAQAGEVFKADCSVSFSPKGGATEAIVDKIAHAKSTIFVQAFSFTSKPIIDALIQAKSRGIKVVALVDGKEPTKNGNLVAYAAQNGLEVYLDKKHKIAHNKVMIIDGVMVHTGSFNFTAGAETGNAENSLWCISEGMAQIYKSNFDAHFAHGVKF